MSYWVKCRQPSRCARVTLPPACSPSVRDGFRASSVDCFSARASTDQKERALPILLLRLRTNWLRERKQPGRSVILLLVRAIFVVSTVCYRPGQRILKPRWRHLSAAKGAASVASKFSGRAVGKTTTEEHSFLRLVRDLVRCCI